jgi:hypothetical protein
MLTMYPHPCVRRVEWVSELVLELHSGVARWVLTPDEVALLDDAGLRWFVTRGYWPGRFGQPASLWLVDAGCDLITSDDGVRWRRLALARDSLDPTEVEAGGEVISHTAALPSNVHDPEHWVGLIPPGGHPTVIASGSTTPHPMDAPHALRASG